jgi:hypothetical protein
MEASNMSSLEQDRTTNRARGAKPCRRATAAMLLALTLGAVPTAGAGGLLDDPCFATCGQYKWFLRKSVEVRDNATCCVPIIKQAKVKEERALALYEAARDPSNSSAEESDLVREANRMIGKRGRLIRKFIDCVNGVTSALAMQQRGLDPLAEYAAACGVSLACEKLDLQ